MPLRLSVHTPPTVEPIHLTDAKLHLRLATTAADAALYTDEDSVLSAHIAAARMVAEIETWKALVLRTYDLYLDEWPCSDIDLPMPPLRAVDSITYTTSDGVEHTVASTEYVLDTVSHPGRLALGYDKEWPTDELNTTNPVRIRYRAGYVVPFTVNYTSDVITALNHPFSDGDVVRLSVSGGALPVGLNVNTDYYVRDAAASTLKLSATLGGAAVDISSAGTGQFFLGEIPPTTIIGMKLVITDLYEERGDTVFTRQGLAPAQLPRAASHHFSMDSVRVPW